MEVACYSVCSISASCSLVLEPQPKHYRYKLHSNDHATSGAVALTGRRESQQKYSILHGRKLDVTSLSNISESKMGARIDS